MSDPTPLTHYYFVDEAGDLNLSNKKGRCCVDVREKFTY